VQLYRYFVSQSSEFCRYNPLCCFSMRVYFCCSYFVIDSVRKLTDTPSYSQLHSPHLEAASSARNVRNRHAVVTRNPLNMVYQGVSKSFRTESITKYTIDSRWEATQSVMVAKLTRLTHKIAIQIHLVAESCTICSSRSRRPVRKLLDTPSYMCGSHKLGVCTLVEENCKSALYEPSFILYNKYLG
jgi:hypothetical protein